MVDRMMGWLKRRSENSAVTYSRFGLPGDEIDERPPPSKIYVAHFDDDAAEFRAFFTHSTRAASISAGFGLSCSIFSFVMFLVEFRWDDHGRGFDLGTVVASLIVLLIGILIHWQIIIGVKKENPVHMVPAIMIYTFMIVVELIVYVLAANHLINSSSMFVYADKQTPTFLTLSIFYLTVVGIQTSMLLSITKARSYYEAKEIHRKAVQVAEHGKRLNPAMMIIYVKNGEIIDPVGDPEIHQNPTSPPPRVILAANDDIA